MKKLTAEKCREQFEDWMTSLPGFELADVERRYDGKYSYSETEWCWKSWQASRQALEIALPILEQQERGEGGWIEWRGGASGSCPVSYATLVEVKSRNGHVAEDCAEAFEWCHEADDDDIIAYRIIPEKPTNQNGEQ